MFFFSFIATCMRIIVFIGIHYSTLGQGLQTSTFPGETIFSIALAIFGLILFALLIGNMQVCSRSVNLTSSVLGYWNL